MIHWRKRIVFGILLLAGIASCTRNKIDFSAQVKPIINQNCISCHGGVKRNADFSLLFREEALDTTKSGKFAIVPGKAHKSEMIRRLTHNDPEMRMPYREDPLSSREIRILKQWINQGAPWGDHWAYLPPESKTPPQVEKYGAYVQNEIDQFILHRLEAEGLQPSEKADSATLLRRLYFDVTGLPPGEEVVSAFQNKSISYNEILDSLLGDTAYGEKWASWWLDMARYSDTKGYERDVIRNIWRFRDWVIQSLNADMPFDTFTIEQLAGDLLPEPTDNQLIATAFHRNTMSNDEGGTEDEEFRVAAVIDRVNTTMEVWQSTTFACVQCHSHPYDPFRHEEYYQMMAFFNNSHDEDITEEYPLLRTYDTIDQKKFEEIKAWAVTHGDKTDVESIDKFLRMLEPKYYAHDFDQFSNGELVDTKWLGFRSGGNCRLANVNFTSKDRLFLRFSTRAVGTSIHFTIDSLRGQEIASVQLPFTDNRRSVMEVPLPVVSGKKDIFFTFYNPKTKAEENTCIIEWVAFRKELPGANQGKDFHEIKNKMFDLLNGHPENTPIMVENEPDQFRPTHIFERGNWLVHGEEVHPQTPPYLNDFSSEWPGNRLGLAMWLTDPENPLTARTVVNRIWEQVFGIGLVSTLEDMGTQGAIPSHPDLLDYLAFKMIHEFDWSIKKLLRYILNSATYQQCSKTNEELRELDPQNQLLARGPRFRLSAEQVRDQALAVSGLLNRKMYGPSVMPYQPDNVWNTVYNNTKWEISEGDEKYRRALYTFMKRTSPYPAFMMFDGSSREVCQVRRIRTNTPLQALVTLNDPVFVEAALHLAEWMEKAGNNPEEKIRAGYQKSLLKEISDSKLAVLHELYEKAIVVYTENGTASKELLDSKDENPELAALSIVANAILNLDEFLTKE